MNIGDFENLQLIPKLLHKIEAMEERLKKFTPPLTTKKEVAKFLDVTPRTINNYISNGYLKENYHFCTFYLICYNRFASAALNLKGINYQTKVASEETVSFIAM